MESEKLGEMASVTAGTSPKGELINSQGFGLPFFQGTKEFGDLFPTAERFTEHPVRVAKKGEILIGVRAPVGEVNFALQDSAIGRGVMAVNAKNPQHVNFLFYFLKNLQGKWNSLGSTGSVFENLSASTLRDISVPAGLHKRQIGDVLLNIDLKIHANISLSKTLEGIAETVFKAWFIDFDPVRAKIAGERPVGVEDETSSLFPDSMEDSELGLIPLGWEVRSVSEFGRVVTGKTPSTSNPQYWGVEIPFVTIPDLHGRLIATSTRRALTQLGADSQQSQSIPRGSTMVSCIATPGLVSYTSTPCQTNQQINSVIPSSEHSPAWLYWHMRSLIPKLIRDSGIGTVFANLNKNDFSNIKSITPPKPLRDAYSEFATPILDMMENLSRQSQTLAEVRDALLPRLISGELKVPEKMLAS
jgi:type I restriction enzyme S subunit